MEHATPNSQLKCTHLRPQIQKLLVFFLTLNRRQLHFYVSIPPFLIIGSSYISCLKLHFVRVDYQSKPSYNGISSFKNLVARLPPRVHSVYYRDNIGNISSSHLRTDYQKVSYYFSNSLMNKNSYD